MEGAGRAGSPIVAQDFCDRVASLETAPERPAGVCRTPGKRRLSGPIRCGVRSGSFTPVGAEQ